MNFRLRALLVLLLLTRSPSIATFYQPILPIAGSGGSSARSCWTMMSNLRFPYSVRWLKRKLTSLMERTLA